MPIPYLDQKILFSMDIQGKKSQQKVVLAPKMGQLWSHF